MNSLNIENKLKIQRVGMKIAILKENTKNETRVAITPQSINNLINLGYEVLLQKDAGVMANYSNDEYKQAGAEIVSGDTIYKEGDIFIKINPFSKEEIESIDNKKTLIAMFSPYVSEQNKKNLDIFAKKEFNAISMDMIPRISRAQKMDVLSSMSSVSGSRAVMEAAMEFGSSFGASINAAASTPRAKVLVIGAGVAGLSAISLASSMGADVRAFDTRIEAKEQVESLNATFLMVDITEDGSSADGYSKVMSEEFIQAEMRLFKEQAKEVDIIITTALIPGKDAPLLITKDMVEVMKSGSIIVDMAAERGGNCELTKKDEKFISKNGVKIIGYTNLASKMPMLASRLYSANVTHLMNDLTPNKDGVLVVDFDDDVIRGASITKQGGITFPPPLIKVSNAKKDNKQQQEIKPLQSDETTKQDNSSLFTNLSLIVVSIITILASIFAPEVFLTHFIVFILACFVGYHVVWSVTPALHTPLMSVTNAISGVIIVGAILQLNTADYMAFVLACVAIGIACINIAGGFGVTYKTLQMFKKQGVR